VPALALSKLGLLKLLRILLLFFHEWLILYTHQSSHKRAIYARKQALIRNNTPTQIIEVDKLIKLIYASRKNVGTRTTSIRART
jgi:hypothetical protein